MSKSPPLVYSRTGKAQLKIVDDWTFKG